MALDLWRTIWEVQPLSKQLEGCDFIVFLTPHPFALEAFSRPWTLAMNEAGALSPPAWAGRRKGPVCAKVGPAP